MARPYSITNREIIAENSTMRVSRMTLSQGEFIPWHCHSKAADIFFPLSGAMEIILKDPEERVILTGKDSYRVDPGRLHKVCNNSEEQAVFLLVQGVGPLDFIAPQDMEKT